MESKIVRANGNTCTTYDDWSKHLLEYMDEVQLKGLDRKVTIWYDKDIIGEFDFKTGLGFIKTGMRGQVGRNKTESFQKFDYKSILN